MFNQFVLRNSKFINEQFNIELKINATPTGQLGFTIVDLITDGGIEYGTLHFIETRLKYASHAFQWLEDMYKVNRNFITENEDCTAFTYFLGIRYNVNNFHDLSSLGYALIQNGIA